MVEIMDKFLRSIWRDWGRATVTKNPVSPTEAISGLVVSLSGTVRLKN